MKSKTTYSLLSAAFVLCLGAIGGLGYYTWQLHQKVDALQVSQSQAASPLGQIPKILHQKNWNPWSNSWDPSGQLAEMQKRMNAMMSQLMPGNPTFNQQGFGFSSNSPKITMKQTPKKYIFDVGVPKGDDFNLNTQLNHNILTISGKVKTKAHHSGSDGSDQSESTSRFSQSVTLADPVEKSGMTIDRKGQDIVITIPKNTG